MKRFDYYTIVKHLNAKWTDRFYDAMSWIAKQLYRIPVFLQVEVEFTTPRSPAEEGEHNYWWFPVGAIGRNEACDTINDHNHFKVWSAWFDWMGFRIGAGICIKCEKEKEE